MFRVGSVTVLATTLNVVGAVEEEEDKAPESFLPLRVAIRRRPTCSLLDLEFENRRCAILILVFISEGCMFTTATMYASATM